MKFTDKDKEYILKCYSGETAQMEQDLPQIERAADASATEYELLNSDGSLNRRISRVGAIRLLGRERWISGIVRSAFHLTAMRQLDDGRIIYFDSHLLFRN